MSYIRSHTFREWWMSLLDYHNKYFSCVHFKGHLMILHVSYLLLNDMVKSQHIRGRLYLNSPPLPLPHRPPSYYQLRRDKDLSKLLPLLLFTLFNVIHFVQFLNALSCSPIMLVQVLQIWRMFFNHIKEDFVDTTFLKNPWEHFI